MQETFVFLLTAYLITEFVVQNGWSSAHNYGSNDYLRRVAIIAVLSWLALASFQGDALVSVLAITATHVVMCWVRQKSFGPEPWQFMLDQGIHLSFIAIIATISPGLWAGGAWGALTTAQQSAALVAATIVSGLVVSVGIGSKIVGFVIAPLAVLGSASSQGVPNSGLLIGRIERLIVFGLALGGMLEGVAVLLTAKAVRFAFGRESASKASSDYHYAGTLMSFGWALGVAALTQAALAHWRPPAPAAPSACVQCPAATPAQ